MNQKYAKNSQKSGSPEHVMLCACEAQEDDMQERGHAHSQSAMSKADDIADRRPPRAGASITCLGLPKKR